jgi:3-deoxy-7-phosphoheptulonate synthase
LTTDFKQMKKISGSAKMLEMIPLPSPSFLKKEIPTHPFTAGARAAAAKIVRREDPRLCVLMGPCSIHDPASALDYAERLKKLSAQLEPCLFLAMRLFVEKPRSKAGWKGMLYDPHLDGSNDIETGLRRSRELLWEINEMGVSCATEILDPLIPFYLSDLISWGLIGARTSASQPHRQAASGMHFPVGFKNDTQGRLDSCIDGIAVSRLPQSHIGVDEEGRVAAVRTRGNPLTHLVLRGSSTSTNFDAGSIHSALLALENQGLEPRVMVDCSHGNSKKDPSLQKIAFESVISQVADGNESILGLMLESHIKPGKQRLDGASSLSYGVSVTDSCLGWEETEDLLLWAADALSTSISSVQS